jgi:hypothetical protein
MAIPVPGEGDRCWMLSPLDRWLRTRLLLERPEKRGKREKIEIEKCKGHLYHWVCHVEVPLESLCGTHRLLRGRLDGPCCDPTAFEQ